MKLKTWRIDDWLPSQWEGGDHDYKSVTWGMLVMMEWLYHYQFPGCVTFFALVCTTGARLFCSFVRCFHWDNWILCLYMCVCVFVHSVFLCFTWVLCLFLQLPMNRWLFQNEKFNLTKWYCFISSFDQAAFSLNNNSEQST